MVGHDELTPVGASSPSMTTPVDAPAPVRRCARRAREARFAAVRADALDEEVDQLLLAAARGDDAARPRAVQPRDGEVGQVDAAWLAKRAGTSTTAR